MAAKASNSGMTSISSVARFLGCERVDVRRMIDLDGLPVTKLPAETRTVKKIPLRGLHEWLLKQTQNPTPGLSDFHAWRADFLATAAQEDAPKPA